MEQRCGSDLFNSHQAMLPGLSGSYGSVPEAELVCSIPTQRLIAFAENPVHVACCDTEKYDRMTPNSIKRPENAYLQYGPWNANDVRAQVWPE